MNNNMYQIIIRKKGKIVENISIHSTGEVLPYCGHINGSFEIVIKPMAIMNGSYDIYQRPQHWMENMWFTRIVFKLYHRVRNWFIT